MEIELIKKLIKKHTLGHAAVVSAMAEADRYYDVDNDILYEKRKPKNLEEAQQQGDTFNPAHTADNILFIHF